jgi:colicin import membrane protein
MESAGADGKQTLAHFQNITGADERTSLYYLEGAAALEKSVEHAIQYFFEVGGIAPPQEWCPSLAAKAMYIGAPDANASSTPSTAPAAPTVTEATTDSTAHDAEAALLALKHAVERARNIRAKIDVPLLAMQTIIERSSFSSTAGTFEEHLKALQGIFGAALASSEGTLEQNELEARHEELERVFTKVASHGRISSWGNDREKTAALKLASFLKKFKMTEMYLGVLEAVERSTKFCTEAAKLLQRAPKLNSMLQQLLKAGTQSSIKEKACARRIVLWLQNPLKMPIKKMDLNCLRTLLPSATGEVIDKALIGVVECKDAHKLDFFLKSLEVLDKGKREKHLVRAAIFTSKRAVREPKKFDGCFRQLLLAGDVVHAGETSWRVNIIKEINTMVDRQKEEIPQQISDEFAELCHEDVKSERIRYEYSYSTRDRQGESKRETGQGYVTAHNVLQKRCVKERSRRLVNETNQKLQQMLLIIAAKEYVQGHLSAPEGGELEQLIAEERQALVNKYLLAEAKAAQETAKAKAAEAKAQAEIEARTKAEAKATQETAKAEAAEAKAQLADQADDCSPCDDPSYTLRDFASSNFKREYEWTLTKRLKDHERDRLLMAVRRVIEGYCTREGIDEARAQQFQEQLCSEWKLKDKVGVAAERLWTSNKTLHAGNSRELEFCFIFSELLRADPASLARSCAIIARALNMNLVAGRTSGVVFPSDGKCWRGGGLNEAHRDFFTVGKKYRVPGFLATSLRQTVTNNFMFRAEAAGSPPVQWCIQLDMRADPQGENSLVHRCKHVNLLRVTHVPGEEEYLFSAFSVFTVREVVWSSAPTMEDPHRITLEAAIDNALEPEDLPLAPWS